MISWVATCSAWQGCSVQRFLEMAMGLLVDLNADEEVDGVGRMPSILQLGLTRSTRSILEHWIFYKKSR